MNKVSRISENAYKELMEKVTWPTWAQLQQSTMIVLVATLVITAMVCGDGLWKQCSCLKLFYSFFKIMETTNTTETRRQKPNGMYCV